MPREKNIIDIMKKVSIGGADQWISIKGSNTENPVLLVLHGGPGGSEMMAVNGCNSDLQRIFTVVNWDQRGAGKSYSKHIPKESINVEQFLSDTHEVILYLKKALGKEKIFLLGHSWGTLLGLTETYRHPENLFAYIGCSQMINGIEGEKIGYNFVLETAKEKNDKNSLKKLSGIAEFRGGTYVNGIKGCIAERKILNKYGGSVYNKDAVKNITKTFLSSRDYSLSEKIKWSKGPLFTLNNLSFDWFQQVDFPAKVKKVDVPVYFFRADTTLILRLNLLGVTANLSKLRTKNLYSLKTQLII